MTRIEKLEKEIQELRLEVARLEGRIQELSRQHIPFQPYINPYTIRRETGDVFCKRNTISDMPCYCKQCRDLRGGLTYTIGTCVIEVPCGLTNIASASTGVEN